MNATEKFANKRNTAKDLRSTSPCLDVINLTLGVLKTFNCVVVLWNFKSRLDRLSLWKKIQEKSFERQKSKSRKTIMSKTNYTLNFKVIRYYGLLVRVLDYQFKGPGFKTIWWLQVWPNHSSIWFWSNEYQELLLGT